MVWTTGSPYRPSPPQPPVLLHTKSKSREGDQTSAPVSNAKVSKVLRSLGSRSRPGQGTETRPGRLGDGTKGRGCHIPRAPVPGHCEPPSPLTKQPGQQSARQGDREAGSPPHPSRPHDSARHIPRPGPTGLVYAHPASAPPRGAPSRCDLAAAA